MDFEDEVAMVTGAASGIGFETARRFIEEGATVAACDIDEEGLKVAEKTLGPMCRTYRMDVVDVHSVNETAERIFREFGRIDVLVNNAGAVREKPLLTNDDADFDFTLGVNLKGTYNVTKAVMKYMVQQRSGAVVNVSSIVGVYGSLGQSAYSSSKAGVNVLARVWAKEFAPYGIRVNSVAPGYVKTPLTANLSKEKIEGIKSKTPLGRLAEPIEIADVILFMASKKASYLTGQVIGVDGGMVM